MIVEILSGDRPVAPGERGEVVITPLHSWAAPLIRYRVGDVCERGPDRCPCGAPQSCIAAVEGRVTDRLSLSDGRHIHPQIFATRIYPLLPSLRRYQFVQSAIDRILVKLQPDPASPPTAGQVEALEQQMRRDFGPAVQLDVVMVQEIPSEPNGKFRTYRGLVAAP